MHRRFARVIPVVALLLVVAGCSNGNTDTTTTPATSTPVTDTFTGLLGLNGATTYSFTVTGLGQITAQLLSLQPDPTKSVGISLGTWNGSICQVVLANDATRQGDVVVGTTSTVGSFCVRIYDANSTFTSPQTYTIEVTHL
jgi:hypothetical protein